MHPGREMHQGGAVCGLWKWAVMERMAEPGEDIGDESLQKKERTGVQGTRGREHRRW